MNIEAKVGATEYSNDQAQWLKQLGMLAVRIAQEYDGAPKRCPRRTCRKSGSCHVRAGEEGPDCAAGMPDHVSEQAGLMLVFLGAVDRATGLEWE
jgi:hypothetical protein